MTDKYYSIKNNFFFYIIFFACFGFAFGQNQEDTNYYSLLDSAEVYVDDNPKAAKGFLNAIPQPLEKSIKGRLAHYYQLSGLINNKNDNPIIEFQNFSQALKHAKLEKDYDIAGWVALELFFNTYIIKKDTTAFKYLDKAKHFYSISNNTNGLAEVDQMYAYVEFYNNNYAKSNKLLLGSLDRFKNIKEDQYYYMYSLFMLSSNYTHQNDLNKAHHYFNLLKSLKNDKTIPKSLYLTHFVTLNTCFAETHLNQKNLDSTLFYLKTSGNFRKAMNVSDAKAYFNLYVDYYSQLNNEEAKNNYLDSLQLINQQQYEKSVNASLEINNALANTDDKLVKATKISDNNRLLIIILVIILFGLGVFIALRYKKIKYKFNQFTKRNDEFEFMQTNHEKLKVKVRGLEDYISELKKELRTITSIDNSTEHKEKIKELYKNIHHHSSTFLAKEENYLDLINDLNIEFFTQIKTLHPKLNDSEIIICYYLFLGFKNKEIAAFLNSSTRAIESKRYRISKKIDNLDNNYTLVEYLNDTFKDSKTRTI